MAHVEVARPSGWGQTEYAINDEVFSPQSPTRGLFVRVENVENNEETPLLGGNLDGRTSLWQHDNPWIRLPARTARSLALTARDLWADSKQLVLIIFIRDERASQIAEMCFHVFLLVAFIGISIPLLISLNNDGTPQGLFMIEFAIIVIELWFMIVFHTNSRY